LVANRDWATLQRAIAGELVLPGSDAYDRARPPFIAWEECPRSQAIVRCEAPEDAAEAIGFARRHGLDSATRCGGHSIAGYSSTGGILIDVTPMRSVVLADGIVVVGAGARTGELVECLLADELAIPTGTCPSVGIAGLTLGGGIGILGRTYGLTCDQLLGAQIVLADGSVVDCDEDHRPDLFWALRGAGAGSFGVVTSLRFRARPAPTMTNFCLTWPSAHAAAVIAAWQRWAPNGPDELAADLALTTSGPPGSEPSVEVYGAVLGAETDALELLDDLRARIDADTVSSSIEELSYRDTTLFQAELSDSDAATDQPPQGQAPRHRFTKSALFERPLPETVVAALVDNLCNRRPQGGFGSLELAPWGGAYSRRPPAATAFAHRDVLFSVEHTAFVDPPASPAAKRAAREWVRRSWAAAHPWGSGRVYPNFPDPELRDPGRAYFGDNLARLLEVKARYDPDEAFRFDQ
jgi:FAD/FMN-containing dehydrogenase